MRRHPGRGEDQRGLAARGVGEVEALEVVPDRAARTDAVRHRVGGVLVGLDGALAGGRGVGVRRLVGDLEVVLVAREARLARRLRAEGDRQQPPAAGDLGGDPRRAQVGLRAAGARVAGDVDADRGEGRLRPPGVHRGLRRGQALVEAVTGEVAGRGERDLALRGQAGCGADLVRGRGRGPGERHGEDERQGGDEPSRDTGRDGQAHGWLHGGEGAAGEGNHTSHTRHRASGELQACSSARRWSAPRRGGSCPWPPRPRPAPRRRGRCPPCAPRPSGRGDPGGGWRWGTRRRRPAPRCPRRPGSSRPASSCPRRARRRRPAPRAPPSPRASGAVARSSRRPSP